MYIKNNINSNNTETFDFNKKKKPRSCIKIMKRIFYDRSSKIPKCFSGYIVNVHKGCRRRRLLIHKYNVGYKFGEFSFTRKPFFFPFRKKKGRKCRR